MAINTRESALHRIAIAAAIALMAASGPLSAHGEGAPEKKAVDLSTAEQKPFGIAGDPKLAKRTMKITMSDTMRFSPAVLTIRRGETLRIVAHNSGKVLHEMILGTEDELAKHAELMRKFPDMEHDEPHMVHVKPGHTEDMVWTFNRPGEFRFACLVPGHYEAGMVGKVIVK
jgi:uncharacterized cupredoxin-like copper-binding protein